MAESYLGMQLHLGPKAGGESTTLRLAQAEALRWNRPACILSPSPAKLLKRAISMGILASLHPQDSGVVVVRTAADEGGTGG